MWLLLSLILLFSTSVTAFAQSVGDLYAKSTQAGNTYRQNYNSYQVARSQHIQYGTGATRLAAFEATKKVLTTRNAWQIAYLTYLRSYLADTTDIANYTQTVVYLNLEKEITDLNDLSNTLSTGDTVESINQNSNSWENRLEFSDKLVSAAKMQIATTKLAASQKQFQIFLDATTSSDVVTLNLVRQKLESSIELKTLVEKSLGNYKDYSWSESSATSQLLQSKQLLIDAALLFQPLI